MHLVGVDVFVERGRARTSSVEADKGLVHVETNRCIAVLTLHRS